MAIGNTVVQLVIGARDRTGAAFKSVRQSLLSVKTLGVAAVGALAGVLGFKGFASLVTDSRNAADEIQKLAIQTGASAEALSQYRFVAEQNGVAFTDLTKGLQRANRTIADAAREGGPAAEALNRIGLSAQALAKLSPEAQFEALADAISGVQDPAERASISVDLFGKAGEGLLRILAGGGDSIRALRQEADQLGLTLTRSQVDAAANANDAINRLSKTWQGLAEQIATSISPALTRLADTFTQKLAPTIRSSAASVVAAIEPLIDQFATWISTVDFTQVTARVTSFVTSLVDGLSYTGRFVAGITGAIQVVFNGFSAGVKTIVVVVAQVIADIVTIINGGVQALNKIGLFPDEWAESVQRTKDEVEAFRDEAMRQVVEDAQDMRDGLDKVAYSLTGVSTSARSAAVAIDDTAKAASAAANAAATAARATDRLAGAHDVAAVSTRNHAAEAAKLVKEIDDDIKATEAAHGAQLQLAQAQRAGLEVQREVALSKGSTADARRVDNELAEQEILIAQLVADQKRIEAELAGKKVAAVWAEAQAIGGLNDEKLQEIELLKIKSQLADEEAKSASAVAGLIEKQVNDRKKLTPLINENTGATQANSAANQSAAKSQSDAYDKLIDSYAKTDGAMSSHTDLLKQLIGFYQGARQGAYELSAGAGALFDSLYESAAAANGFRFDIAGVGQQASVTNDEMGQLTQQILDQGAVIAKANYYSHFGNSFSRYEAAVATALAKTKIAYAEEQKELVRLERTLSSVGSNGATDLIAIEQATQAATDGLRLLNDEDLGRLRGAIDDATRRMNEFRQASDDARRGVAELEAEIAREKGDTERADLLKQELDYQQRLAEIERERQEASARGDKETVDLLNQQIDRLKELNELRQRNIREGDDRRRDRDDERPRDRDRRRTSSSSGGTGGGPELGRLVLTTDRGDVSVFTTPGDADILAAIARDKSRAL